MGNATIWWWPTGSAVVQEIDLGSTFSDLTFNGRREGSDSVAGTGRSTRYDLGGYRSVRISKERIQNDAALVRDLEALVRHLQAGGVCMATLDKDKAWGTWSSSAIIAGGASFNIAPAGNAFSSVAPSAALTSGDEIMIESPNPEYLLDVNTYSGISGSTLTVGESVRTGFQLSPCFVRYRYFYPVLRLPAGAMSGDILTHDRLMNHTLVLPLEERPGDIDGLRLQALSIAGSGGEAFGSRLDDLVSQGSDQSAPVRVF